MLSCWHYYSFFDKRYLQIRESPSRFKQFPLLYQSIVICFPLFDMELRIFKILLRHVLQMWYLLSSLHISMKRDSIKSFQYHPFIVTFVLYKHLLHTTQITWPILIGFKIISTNFLLLLTMRMDSFCFDPS